MSIAVFDKRIQPPRTAGLPDVVFFAVPAAVAFFYFGFLIPLLIIKIAAFSAAAGCVYLAWHIWSTYDDYLILPALESGKKSRSNVSFFTKGKKGYMEYYHWRTYCSEYAISHDDEAVSVAFVWDGVHDRLFDEGQFRAEHRRRVALQKTFRTDIGLTVENHLVRFNDTSLIEPYLERGRKLVEQQRMAPIAFDVRQQIAELYRPMARSNRVMTVLSVGKPQNRGFWSHLLPSSYLRLKNEAGYLKALNEVLQAIESSYTGFRLLSREEYASHILKTNQPYTQAHKIDWRFPLSAQLVTEKPQVDDEGFLRIADTYYRCCLIQNYPNLDFGWTFSFVEANVDLHISQIICPISADKAVDKNKKQSRFEKDSISESRGTEKAIDKLGESAAYRTYVTRHKLAVANNAYIVTFFHKDKERVKYYANDFKKRVLDAEGLVRDNPDLQLELFRLRLPGQGRYSTFLREDHADTLAVMAPFTTFPHGEDEPESLRISSSGQLVGLSPSKLKVPHKLVVAQSGAGKDTLEGATFYETYPEIRYDFIELGNSHQGSIESVGGHYCRAKEQVINPLASYEDFQSAKTLTEGGKGKLDVDFVRTQTGLLAPVFKGMRGGDFTRPEEVVVNRLVRHLYENPVANEDAPRLPDLLAAFDNIKTESDNQTRARDELGEALFEFLSLDIGSCFKERDQFTISPIANGVDFDKLDGELFDFYMVFIAIRFATAAMSRGVRGQIVLNEFKVLLDRAPAPIRHITQTIDRMGRKDWVGLTRITQGFAEIQSIDPEASNSIQNRVLLSRGDTMHEEIGALLNMPAAAIGHWKNFKSLAEMDKLGYREGIICEGEQWYRLHLKFPNLLLDLMNTQGEDKLLRDKAYSMSQDPYQRIEIFNALRKERDDARF